MSSTTRSLRPSRRSEIPGFQVMDVLARIEELRAQGRDIVSLTAGEPGSGAPPAVNDAAARIHAEQTVLNYSPGLGIRPLREAIAAHAQRWYGVDVSADRVAVTTGSSGAFMLTFLAAFDAGDRVALARPGYPAYRNILTSLGVEVVDLPCGPDVRFQPTVELLQRTVAETGPLDGLILASPANPTGTMIPEDQMAALTRWCRTHAVRLISDEIYHGITDGTVSVSALQHSDDAVVVSSFSKYWGMPGWRLGWAVLPEDLIGPVARLGGNLALCAPHGSQLAAVEAFSASALDFAQSQVAEYARARTRVLDALEQLGWSDAAPADGAFYVYARIGEHLQQFGDASAYCRALLEEAGVAMVPGTDFDPVDGHEWVRLSLAPGPAQVAEGLERILSFHQRARALTS
ncbi:pyridoxal phosphate-dependent aminotransferase [Nesterenkonia aerolata]|uniref:Aminotransferase n=1 Tax=Nesterenkonia aerolata TaxID=3074079 RepID=A0ABU2DPU4_9MICC|nr:aminotransferase class I/II-fold pyridoxal phosphate-dependent enzyme [Nesterenkonia sp. LY-0111]MDR8018416.1 aminotransferase class I/II-fold pyridoxal phosphate-dependent enzyme [Nesterenkonia sp. LY-0111]